MGKAGARAGRGQRGHGRLSSTWIHFYIKTCFLSTLSSFCLVCFVFWFCFQFDDEKFMSMGAITLKRFRYSLS